MKKQRSNHIKKITKDELIKERDEAVKQAVQKKTEEAKAFMESGGTSRVDLREPDIPIPATSPFWQTYSKINKPYPEFPPVQEPNLFIKDDIMDFLVPTTFMLGGGLIGLAAGILLKLASS